MGIHYATATAADAHAWLDAIRTFATGTLGWTEDTWSSSGGISRWHGHNTSGEHITADLRSRTLAGQTDLALGIACATAYNSGADWDAQTGISGLAYATDLGGSSMAYHLFGGTGSDGEYCHAVLELASGVFASVHFGSLDKADTFTGGAWCDAAYWVSGAGASWSLHHWPWVMVSAQTSYRGALRADLDSAVAPKWWGFGNVSIGSQGDAIATNAIPYTAGGPSDYWAQAQSPSELNGRTILWPVTCYGPRPSLYWSALGQIPGVRTCSMELLDAGEEITMGSDVYLVFPARAKGSAFIPGSGGADSGWLGFAYRKS